MVLDERPGTCNISWRGKYRSVQCVHKCNIWHLRPTCKRMKKRVKGNSKQEESPSSNYKGRNQEKGTGRVRKGKWLKEPSGVAITWQVNFGKHSLSQTQGAEWVWWVNGRPADQGNLEGKRETVRERRGELRVHRLEEALTGLSGV